MSADGIKPGMWKVVGGQINIILNLLMFFRAVLLYVYNTVLDCISVHF